MVADHRVVVDRPKGSSHPRYPDLIYPLDYGYLEGTSSMDGGGIDVWIGSNGIRAPQAVLLTIDLKKNDLEIKLMLGCTDQDIQTLAFHNDHSSHAILLPREWDELEFLKNRHSIRRLQTNPYRPNK